MDLAFSAHVLARGFPRHEQFALTLQLTKAAGSIPANIAEGCGRSSTRELIRVLDIARGSLQELDTHIELALRLEYLTSTDEITGQIQEVSRMLSGLKSSLVRKLEEGEQPAES